VEDGTMIQKALNYLKDVKTEMAKVSWPTRDELYESTLIVLALSCVLAIFVFGVDQGLSNILKVIF
jgi:preprotein translocase subunit SecE